MNIKKIPNKIKLFLKEVRLEIKKVNWPTRKETIKYTIIVVALSLVVAVFLGGLDFIFQYLLEKFIM